MIYTANRQPLLEITFTGRVVVFILVARKILDDAACWQLETAIGDMYNSGVRNFIFNFQKVQFINTTALAKLYDLHKSLSQEENPEKVRLSNVRPEIRHEFEKMNLHTAFDIHPDLQTALASFPQN